MNHTIGQSTVGNMNQWPEKSCQNSGWLARSYASFQGTSLDRWPSWPRMHRKVLLRSDMPSCPCAGWPHVRLQWLASTWPTTRPWKLKIWDTPSSSSDDLLKMSRNWRSASFSLCWFLERSELRSWEYSKNPFITGSDLELPPKFPSTS